MESLGKLICALGIVLVAVGAGFWLLGDKLSWLGNLPGDIKIEQPGFNIYFPITSMLLISLSLSLVMWVIGFISRLIQ